MSSACCDVNEEKKVPKKHINARTIATVISGIGTVVGFLLSYVGIEEGVTNIIFLASIVVGGVYVLQGALEGLTKKKFLSALYAGSYFFALLHT